MLAGWLADWLPGWQLCCVRNRMFLNHNTAPCLDRATKNQHNRSVVCRAKKRPVAEKPCPSVPNITTMPKRTVPCQKQAPCRAPKNVPCQKNCAETVPCRTSIPDIYIYIYIHILHIYIIYIHGRAPSVLRGKASQTDLLAGGHKLWV